MVHVKTFFMNYIQQSFASKEIRSTNTDVNPCVDAYTLTRKFHFCHAILVSKKLILYKGIESKLASEIKP